MLLVFSMGTSTGLAQSALQSPAVSQTTVAGRLDLARLLDLCAQRLKVSIEYDPAPLRTLQVTLRSSVGMSDTELWASTNQLLSQRGFTTVRPPGSDQLTVVKLEEANRQARIETIVTLGNNTGGLVGNADAGQPRAGFRSVPVKLRHISAKEASDAIKPLMSRASAGGNAGGGGGVAGGLSALGTDGLVLISDLSPRIDEAIALLRALDLPESATTIEEIPARNLSAQQLAATVAQVLAKRDVISGEKLPGDVIVAPGGTGVLLIAPRRAVESWKALIATVDRREPVSTVSYTPRLFAVRDVAALIQQIVSASPTGAAGVSVDDRFKVIVEEPTATLLVTGTPSQHEKISELMTRLDSVPGEARRPVRTFAIRNRPVSELLTTLEKMVAAGILDAGSDAGLGRGSSSTSPAGPYASGASTASAGTGGFTSAPPPVGAVVTGPGAAGSVIGSSTGGPGLFGPGRSDFFSSRTGGSRAGLPISLTADDGTNTLIAVGDGRLLQQLESLLKTLDVRQPQVMLEVFLVSLTDSDAITLGVELERLRLDSGIVTRMSSLFGLSTSTTVAGVRSRETGDSAGFSGVVLDPGEFSVIVKALQTVNQGRSVSLPRVLVANNQSATFNSIAQVPYSAAFTAGNNASTQTFGGTLDAGTQLTIKPQITEGESLLLDYNIALSSFTGEASGNLPPPKQSNTIKSIATIPDGHTVVVGGVELTTDGTQAKQIPGLGSIPLLGDLFKSQSKSASRTRFFVFIKASVMRSQTLSGLRHLSIEAMGPAGLSDDWPKPAPREIKVGNEP